MNKIISKNIIQIISVSFICLIILILPYRIECQQCCENTCTVDNLCSTCKTINQIEKSFRGLVVNVNNNTIKFIPIYEYISISLAFGVLIHTRTLVNLKVRMDN